MTNLKLNMIKDEFALVLERLEYLKTDGNLLLHAYNYLLGPLERIETLLKGE